MGLIYFVLSAYGLTQIIVYSSIFSNLREQILDKSDWFGKLVHCPMCMGWWVGVFLFGINGLTELFSFEYNVANLLVLSCLSSGTSYALCMIFSDFGLKLGVLIGGSQDHE